MLTGSGNYNILSGTALIHSFLSGPWLEL